MEALSIVLKLKSKNREKNYNSAYRSENDSKKNIVYIALGSNKNDKISFIKKAAEKLKKHPNVQLIKSSSVYETKPIGNVNQDNFMNAVIKVRTSLKVKEFFILVKSLEKEIGRKTSEKWGPREIDLDILFFNDSMINNKALHIPHREIEKRDFVLIPLKEIAKNHFHPVLKQKIDDICTENINHTIIRKTRFKII